MTFHIWILESPIILSTLVFKNQKILISFWTLKGKTSLELEYVAVFFKENSINTNSSKWTFSNIRQYILSNNKESKKEMIKYSNSRLNSIFITKDKNLQMIFSCESVSHLYAKITHYVLLKNVLWKYNTNYMKFINSICGCGHP